MLWENKLKFDFDLGRIIAYWETNSPKGMVFKHQNVKSANPILKTSEAVHFVPWWHIHRDTAPRCCLSTIHQSIIWQYQLCTPKSMAFFFFFCNINEIENLVESCHVGDKVLRNSIEIFFDFEMTDEIMPWKQALCSFLFNAGNGVWWQKDRNLFWLWNERRIWPCKVSFCCFWNNMCWWKRGEIWGSLLLVGCLHSKRNNWSAIRRQDKACYYVGERWVRQRFGAVWSARMH